MSTRSLIGIQMDKETVKYSYCHFDGYPEYNGQILSHFYTDRAKIMDLISGGSFRGLQQEIHDISYYNVDDEMGNQVIPLKRYFEKEDLHWDEYRYLYTLENKWVMYDVYDNKISDLSEVLKERNIS